jgi:hypothetical protein
LTSGRVSSGTISPSMIWVGNTFQFDIEALIPINRPSGSNGVIAQLHLYLNDIDPAAPANRCSAAPSSLQALSAELISRTRSPSRQRSIQAIYFMERALDRAIPGLGKVASRTPMSVLPPASVRSVPKLCSQARRRGPFHCALSRAVSLGPLKGGDVPPLF